MNNEFGDFDIISNTYKKGTATYARFKCRICGKEKDTVTHRMKGNNTGSNSHEKSCLRQDEIERRKENINTNDFGDFVLLKDLGSRNERDQHHVGLFKCNICGREKEVNINVMANDVGTSHMYCINHPDVRFTLHFKSLFNNMKTRCNNPNYEKFHRYGGRGITCDYEYLIDFYDDFYDLYLKHVEQYGEKETTIDRINADGNYTKDNIRFATNLEQFRNRTDMRSVKIIDTINGDEWYFNSIGYAAEFFNISRTRLDNILYDRKGLFHNRYTCNYYDNTIIKPILIMQDPYILKPLIEFFN